MGRMLSSLLVTALLLGTTSAQIYNSSLPCLMVCNGRWVDIATVTEPAEVVVGAYINSLADLNVEGSVIRIDSWFWIKWDPCHWNYETDAPWRPDASLKLENAINRVDVSRTPTAEDPICISDDSKLYFEWRVEGQFFSKLSFKNYPLDGSTINLLFEDALWTRSTVVYVADMFDKEPASGIQQSAFLPGWRIGSLKEKEETITYTTDTFKQVYGDVEYSRYSIGVEIFRGPQVYFLKLLPPIIITLAISGMVFMIDIEGMETRIATGVTGLLTAVFLQLSFNENLPKSLDYLTLMDWVFNLAYCAICFVIVECIYIRKLYYRMFLSGEKLQDTIQMSKLSAEPQALDTNPDSLMNLASETKRRKSKIKKRIRHIEKIIFIAYMSVLAFMVILVSIIALAQRA